MDGQHTTYPWSATYPGGPGKHTGKTLLLYIKLCIYLSFDRKFGPIDLEISTMNAFLPMSLSCLDSLILRFRLLLVFRHCFTALLPSCKVFFLFFSPGKPTISSDNGRLPSGSAAQKSRLSLALDLLRDKCCPHWDNIEERGRRRGTAVPVWPYLEIVAFC